MDSRGRLFEGNPFANAVWVYARGASDIQTLQPPPYPPVIKGVCVHEKTHEVFVLATANRTCSPVGRIVALDAETGRITRFFEDTDQIQYASACAPDQHDPDKSRLLVADFGSHAIVAFDATSGRFMHPLVLDKQLIKPTALAVNSRGDLIVADDEGRRVRLFTSDGHWFSELAWPAPQKPARVAGATHPRRLARAVRRCARPRLRGGPCVGRVLV